MQHTIIYNFNKLESIEVSDSNFDTIGPLVTLKQKAGSCWFSFSMTPNQARYMAKALIEHADNLEDAQ